MSFRNQALWDRLLHIGVGLAMLGVGWWVLPQGLWGATLRVFGIFPLITGIIGWSPLYAILGRGTWRGPRAGGRRPPVA